ncbi:MAG: hypothetical protein IPH07_12015 [Deltaproteobacteria bacterium]|nr:hypothetical protein [Deltaproteobacteria bacterium]
MQAPPAAAPPGPELAADGPAGFRERNEGLPPGAAKRPSKGGGGASLRLVARDEVERWEAEDRKQAAAAKPAPTRSPTRAPSVTRTATAAPADEQLRYRRPPHPPQRSAAFVLGYRYFSIRDRLGRAQNWHLASLEVTPMRRYVRINLLTEFGIEGGPAATRGDRADMLLMERLGLGMQYPHVVTPFLEFQAGVGGARVELFGRNDIALLYTLGLDLGAQFAVAKWLYLHAALGWIRPTFVWREKVASYDRLAFKLGVGF